VRRREHALQLRGIERIRTVQLLAAELAALSAAQDLDRSAQNVTDERGHLDGIEAGWRQAVARGAIAGPTVLSWSAALRQQTSVLEEAELHLVSSRTADARARQGWREANSRHRLASEAADFLSRRLAKRQGEKDAAELIDQYLICRGRS